MNILLVDDEKDITEIISEVLVDKGHSVSAFDCPKKALEDLQKNNYDVIVSDYNFPFMRGQDFYLELTKEKKNTFKKFLFLTGAIVEDLGFVSGREVKVLSKPFDLFDLVNEIEAA